MRPTSMTLLLLALLAVLVVPALAQDEEVEVIVVEPDEPTRSAITYLAENDDVRPFQTWIEDATIARGIVVEPFVDLGDYGSADLWRLGAQAGFEAADQFEAGVRWSLNHLSFDNPNADSQTGLSDLRGYARYRLRPQNPQISAGIWVDLPVGSDDVGAGNFNVEAFGALRWHLKGGWILMANAGIESVEQSDNRDTGLQIGGAALYPLSRDISALGELLWRTASDYGAFSLGFDYRVSGANHVRAAVGFGFDDGAPDLELILGFLMAFD